MQFKEKKRRHDDAHNPMGGRGRRARAPQAAPRGTCAHPIITTAAYERFDTCSMCGEIQRRELKFAYTDSGYCRIYYKYGTRLFCLQEEAKGVYAFYICSCEGEPSHVVPLEAYVFQEMKEPDAYEAGFMAFLREKGALQ